MAKILLRVSLVTFRLGNGVFSGHGTRGNKRLCKHQRFLEIMAVGGEERSGEGVIGGGVIESMFY